MVCVKDMSSHANTPKLPGDLASRYGNLRLIGKGGMGEVYRAWDDSLGREVALKWVHADRRSLGEYDTRLKREARALARISHPNVVRVYDVHVSAEGCLYSMEFVEGRSLADALKCEGAMKAEEAVAIAIALADALALAHSKGIIHRDIKGENVLLSTEGVPLLLDFGLVRFDRTEMTALTRTGEFVGTLYVMPPELFAGEELAAPGDVFQLGLLLHEMLTGKPLYGDLLPQDLLAGKGHQMAKAGLNGLEKDCAHGPAVLLRRCLAERPQQRPTAAELRDGLKTWLEGDPVAGEEPADPNRSARHVPHQASTSGLRPILASGRGLWLLLLPLLGAILFALGGFFGGSPPAPAPTPRLRIEARGAEAIWTTRLGRRFRWELRSEGKVLHRGGEDATSCIHAVRLSSLSPDKGYRLRIEEGDRHWEFPFRTPAPHFDGRVWTHADPGRFSLLSTSLPTLPTKLIVRDDRSSRSVVLTEERQLITIEDLSPSASHYGWQIEVAGLPLLRGRTPTTMSWIHVPGKDLDPDTGSARGAEIVGGPLWHDDRVYVASSGGMVSAFALDSRNAEGGRGYGLRLLWTCMPAGQAMLAPFVNISREPGCLSISAGERLLVATLGTDARIKLHGFDIRKREESWARRSQSTTSPLVDGLPTWAQVDYGDWNRPLFPGEHTQNLGVFGTPADHALLHEGMLYTSYRGLRSAVDHGDRIEVIRIDPRNGKMTALGHWPPKDGRDLPQRYRVRGPLRRASGRIFLTVQVGSPTFHGGLKSYDHILLSGKVDGASSSPLRLHRRYRTPASHSAIALSNGAKRLYLPSSEGMLVIDPETGETKLLPFEGPDEVNWRLVSCLGPTTFDERDWVLAFAIARRSVSTAAMGLEENFGYLGTIESDAVVLRGPRLCTEVDARRLSEPVILEPWSRGLFALTLQSAITIELPSGRFATAARLHCRRAAVDGRDLVAITGPRGSFAVVPVRGLTPQRAGRVELALPPERGSE